MIVPSMVFSVPDCDRELRRLARAFNAEERWRLVNPDGYIHTPASTSTIQMDTTGLSAGLPVAYSQGNTTYYGIAQLVSAGLLTIAGAPLDTAKQIQLLWIGKPELVATMEFFGSGAYGDLGYWYTKFKPNRRYWSRGRAYVALFVFMHETNATAVLPAVATQPQVNIALTTGAGATRYVLTANSGNGVTPSTAWAGSGVGIDPATYYVDFTNRISLEVKVADTGATRAQDFSGLVTFVLE